MKIDKHKILLIFIILIAVFFRFYNLKDNFNFTYDAGRDHIRINNIYENKDIKIVGTETDIPGVFSGAFYYYMLIPGQIITKGNPNASIYLLAFINLLAVPFIYLITKELFDNKTTALIASFISAVSYFLVNYSRFLSNASPLPLSIAVFFYGLLLWKKGKKNGFPLAMLGLGLSTQFDYLYIYLFVYLLIIKLLYNPKLNKKELLKGFVAGLITFSTYIIAEIKFKFLGTRELISFIAEGVNEVSAQAAIDKYINKIVRITGYNFFHFNFFLSLLIFVFMIYFSFTRTKKKKYIENLEFVLLWFFSSLLVLGFNTGGVNLPLIINSGIIFPAIILVAYFGQKVYAKNKLLFALMIVMIFTSNLILYFESNWVPSDLNNPGNKMLLKYQKQALDYMYQEADGKDFAFCGLTQPLFINSTWAHLFEWYGKSKYGYLPYWSGPKQNPQFGASDIQKEEEFKETRFIIYEPPYGLKEEMYTHTRIVADRTTEVVEKKNFGAIEVEKRRILKGEEREQAEKEFQLKSKQYKDVLDSDIRYNCL